MMEPCIRRISILFLAATLAFCGCDGPSGAHHASTSTTQANVKGKVTLKGKPLAKAEIRFNSANVYRKTASTATATIADNGYYEIKTLVGENTVTLVLPAIRKNAKLQYMAKTLDVQEGENTFDLHLP
jgi:hypothetical protein